MKKKVAVVAGATRGAGRGIARGLGEAGMVVYCTGRSVRGKPSPYGRPETIEETAELITAAGGKAIAVRVDHTVESEVEALFARVKKEQKRLDVLVDSVAGEDKLLGGWTGMLRTDLTNAEAALRQSLLSHLITAKHGAPLLKKGGLIVQVSEGDLPLMGGGNMVSALVKAGLKALAVFLDEELRKRGVASVSITPGFLRSEAMLDHFGVTEANWREGGKKDRHFLESETPLFLGRAVAALAADRKAIEKAGQLLSSWELGREYRLEDADGRKPDWGKHWRNEVVPSMAWLRDAIEREAVRLEGLARRARRMLGKA